MRLTGLVLAGCFAAAAGLPAQQAPPSFEAVSIKRNTTGAPGGTLGIQPGGRWVMVNGSIRSLVTAAYPIESGEIVGLPEWAVRERYDVQTVAAGQPSPDEMQAMFRTLVVERLNLVTHYEEEERDAYSLVLSRSDGQLGPAMQRMPVDCAAAAAAARAGRPMQMVPAPNGMAACSTSVSSGIMRTGGMTMAGLARSIWRTAGRFIVDNTGLMGDYAFTLEYAPDPRPGAANGAADDRPSIFTALQEQLGLRLVPTRAPVRVLVIDRIERPTEN